MPLCKESQSERAIANFLRESEVDFVQEYRIKECRDKKPLPFDFAIFSHDKLELLVEFDGIHHFKPVRKYGGASYFEKVKQRDAIKTEYCVKNGIPLIHIPYWKSEEAPALLKEALNI